MLTEPFGLVCSRFNKVTARSTQKELVNVFKENTWQTKRNLNKSQTKSPVVLKQKTTFFYGILRNATEFSRNSTEFYGILRKRTFLQNLLCFAKKYQPARGGSIRQHKYRSSGRKPLKSTLMTWQFFFGVTTTSNHNMPHMCLITFLRP